MTKTEIALLRWGQLPMFAAIVGWILGFVGVAAGLWRPHWYWVLYFIATVAMTALCIQRINAARERYIREAPLPRFLQRKLREAYPQLSAKDGELVERGLRQFFLACLRSRKFVAMPSQAVDVLWHEFILHTQAYKRWCTHALGRRGMHNDGLRRAWFWACKEESIDPKAPSRLPLLFALDAKFAIPNGFHYVPDCRLTGAQSSAAASSSSGGCGSSPYCGTDFSDGSYSGSSGDFGGSDSSDGSGGGGGDGGGCGGGGD